MSKIIKFLCISFLLQWLFPVRLLAVDWNPVCNSVCMIDSDGYDYNSCEICKIQNPIEEPPTEDNTELVELLQWWKDTLMLKNTTSMFWVGVFIACIFIVGMRTKL